MGHTTSFELYVRQDRDWILEQIFDDRCDALRRAQELVNQRPTCAIQVVQERVSVELDEVVSTIIFREVPFDKGAATFRRRPKTAVSTAGPPAPRSAGIAIGPALTVLMTAAIAVGLVGLTLLANLPR